MPHDNVFKSIATTEATIKEMTIANAGTNSGITIDQDGDAVALNIDSEATTATNYGISVDMPATTCAANFQTSGSNLVRLAHPEDTAEGSSLFKRNLASATTASAVVRILQDNTGDDQPCLTLDDDGTGPCLLFDCGQDVEVIDFDACTDGGTSRTVIAGSLKVQMPNGTTGYINFYNAP